MIVRLGKSLNFIDGVRTIAVDDKNARFNIKIIDLQSAEFISPMIVEYWDMLKFDRDELQNQLWDIIMGDEPVEVEYRQLKQYIRESINPNKIANSPNGVSREDYANRLLNKCIADRATFNNWVTASRQLRKCMRTQNRITEVS